MAAPLTQGTRRSVVCNGRVYFCDLSFNAVLDALRVISDGGMNDADKLDFCIWRLVQGHVPASQKEKLLDVILSSLAGDQSDPGPHCLDFEQDAGPIRAGFLQAYGIDLEHERGRLSWETFLTLLQNLPKGTRMAEIIETRLRPIPVPTKYNAQEIATLTKAKAAVALKAPVEEQTSVWNAMFDSLLAMTKR